MSESSTIAVSPVTAANNATDSTTNEVLKETQKTIQSSVMSGVPSGQTTVRTHTTVKTTTQVSTTTEQGINQYSLEIAAEKAYAERILAIKASVMQPDPLLDFPYKT